MMPTRTHQSLSSIALLILGLLLIGCEKVDEIRDRLRDQPPHERYAQTLREADLHRTAVGQAWFAASERALDTAVSVDLPFREVAYLNPAEPTAVGYRFDVQRGQVVAVDVTTQLPDSARLFLDLYEVPTDTIRPARHVTSADSTRHLEREASRDQSYVLRIQPELLQGGRYTVTIRSRPAFIFPVSGKDSRAIRSVFGDPREGGRREHHGVDIFATRGTPVLAADDGYIRSVRTGGLGGKVVWQRGRRGRALYYAHLDSQLVREGTRVQAGDTLGLVGNTGNARTTPPHLHFGIYHSGPIDPYYFIHTPRAEPAAVTVDTAPLGQWVRVNQQQVRLRRSPDTRMPPRRELPRHTSLRIVGGSARWYRVVLPDGTSGFVAASLTEPARTPIRSVELASGQPIRQRPTREAAFIDSLSHERSVPVLGQFGDYLHVQSPQGRTGWIATD